MILTAQKLGFSYRGGPSALSAVDLTVRAGERVVIVGPNGGGKSTLAKILTGALVPSAGGVFLDDRPLASIPLRERAGLLAYVAPSARFGAPLCARRILELGRRCRPPTPTIIDETIERFELADLADRSVLELSAGQRQRVSLARAWGQLADAERGVLIADEPTSAMDPRFARLALDSLHELAGRGVAVVAVIHDLSAACRFAESALVLGPGGRVISSGSTDAALCAERLREAFGIDFVRANTPGGPVIVPAL